MDNQTQEILSEKTTNAKLFKEYICTIADKIQFLIQTEKFTPSDIMVLVQRRKSFVTPLVNELKIRGVDVAGSDRIVLPEFPAIRDLLNLVRFCLDPSDDYSLCCTLKSPFYRLNEHDILNICSLKNVANNGSNLSKSIPASVTVFNILETVHPDIFNELNQIIEWSKDLAPYSFFMRLLNTNEHREKMVAALGAQILDPMEEFLTICLAYERTQPGTLRHFLKWFITGGSEIKRDMDTTAGVRIVTVHGSKGLEASVVFLIDTVRTPKDKSHTISSIEPDMLDKKFKIPDTLLLDTPKLNTWLWSPKKNHSEKLLIASERAMSVQIAEYYRLLYVAMTRARDRLYIYGLKTKSANEISWHNQLMEILSQMPGIQLVDGTIRISNGE